MSCRSRVGHQVKDVGALCSSDLLDEINGLDRLAIEAKSEVADAALRGIGAMPVTSARRLPIFVTRLWALRRTPALVFFWLLALTPGASVAQESSTTDPRLDDLLATWRCPVAAYLERLHQSPTTLKHRYLILWSRPHPEFYVQCMFHDEDRQFYCEAASGFYRYKDRIGSYANPQRLEALAGLGFSTDGSKGNFIWDGPFRSVEEAATLIIATLARVYDFDSGDGLEYSAPLLAKRRSNRVKAGLACAKISTLEKPATGGST